MLSAQISGDKKIKKIFFSLFLLYNSLPVFASDGPYASAEFQEVLKQDVYEPNYFTLIFGLVFVIALIYFTGFFYQKLIGVNSKINKKTLCIPEANKIKILSSIPLGQGKNVYVTEINGKFLVLGATQNQITLLREFAQDEVKEYIKNVENSGESNDDKNC